MTCWPINVILFRLNYMYWDSSHEIDCIMALLLSPGDPFWSMDAGTWPGFCGFGTINTNRAHSSPCWQEISACCSYILGYLSIFYFWGLHLGSRDLSQRSSLKQNRPALVSLYWFSAYWGGSIASGVSRWWERKAVCF